MKAKLYYLFFICLLVTTSAFAQKQLESLGRGVVAVRTSPNQVFVSWRMFITDPTNVGFNLYRGATKVNATPIVTATNYTDNTSANEPYTVRPVINGVEQAASRPATVMNENILRVPLVRPAGGTTPASENYTYNANDVSVGDVDGDGEYEVIVKWDPSNAKDNSQQGYTGNVYLDAYTLTGTHLWRIDLGRNIRAGAHYTQFIVFDLDGDGKAEVACKTAPNTKAGTGNFLSMGPAANDDDAADYRTGGGWAGFISTGPEYLTIFNGQTGAEMATTLYVPDRNPANGWGNTSETTNRVDRFLAGVGYFDGEKPSLLMCRGYYGRSVLVAWDWRNGQLTQRWKFDTSDSGNGGYASQGNHSLSINDVDGDGKDEVVYGSMAVDHDGRGLYTTGLGHGDAQHVGDLVPSRPGLESWSAHESPTQYAGHGLWLRDARTGERLWGVPATGDVGRALTADIDPRYPGNEMWGAAGAGTYSATGKLISTSKPSMNFAIWWDGDLLRELLDDGKMDKWSTATNSAGRIFTVYNTGASSNNGTKATPGLTADILGDWREEMVYRNPESSQLLIITTTIPTPHKLYTLMHDSQYRVAVAWQNVAYNQPPHTSYFLGADMNAQLTAADNPAAVLQAMASEGTPMNLNIRTLSAALAGNPQLTFAKAMGPGWLTVAADGTLGGTPQDADKGTGWYTVHVLSENNVIDILFLQVTVEDTNSPPVWSAATILAPNALVGYNFNPSIAGFASDPDSRTLFSKVSGPAWLTVSSDGTLGGMPRPAELGENTFVVRVTDEQGASADAQLSVLVTQLSLVNHYKFEDNAEDAEGQKHGTTFGSPVYAEGAVDKALVFNGTNNHVQLPNGIVNHQRITIATWVKWDGGSDFQRIFDFGDNTTNYMYLTPAAGGNLRFGIRTSESAQQELIQGPALPSGVWKHVALTMDGPVGKLYVDGVEVGQNTALTLAPSSLGNTMQNLLGKSQWPDPLFRGQLDDFRIYNYPLSVTEILAIKNLEPAGLAVLKSSKTVPAIVGAPFEYITVAANKPTAFSAPNLPQGFSIDNATGVINGTPVAVGDLEINLQITNSAGVASETIVVNVQSNVPVVSRVVVEGNRNTLTWAPLQNLGFRVKRSLNPDGPFTTLADVTANSYTDNAVTNGTTYYYLITSMHNNQELSNSAVVKASMEVHQVAYYNFDETSGQVGLDSWGNKNATLLAGVQRNTGKFGSGILLNGATNSYVTLPAGVVSTLNDFTIATWVKMDVKANWARVFDIGTGTATYMFLTVQAGSNTVRYAIRSNNGTEQQLSYSYNLPLDTWTHIAITQSGNTSSMYINGALVATGPITITPSMLGNTTLNYLGRSQYAADPLLRGSIDDFRILDRALSASEVAFLVNFNPLSVSRDGEMANIQVYPNPASTYLQVSGQDLKNCQYRIFTVQGSKILEGKLTDGKVWLPAGISTGLYIMQLLQGEKTVQRVPFVVQY